MAGGCSLDKSAKQRPCRMCGVSTIHVRGPKASVRCAECKLKCVACGEQKPRTLEFYYANSKNADGLSSYCKACLKTDSCQTRAKKLRPNPGTRERYREAFYGVQSVQDRRDLTEYRALLLGDPCVFCGEPATTVDHIQPFALDGEHCWENLAGACLRCNTSKRAIPLLQFLLKKKEEEPWLVAA